MCSPPSPHPVAERPVPARTASGRQTLGSNHDAPRLQREAADGHLPSAAAGDGTRPVWWNVFVDQCAALQGEPGRAADRLVPHVEAGWGVIIELKRACERQRRAYTSKRDHRLMHVLGYVESEAIGSYIECVQRTSRLVPVGQSARAELDDLLAVSGRFERAVILCGLLGESGRVPRGLKESLQQAATALADWSTDFGALITVFCGADDR